MHRILILTCIWTLTHTTTLAQTNAAQTEKPKPLPIVRLSDGSIGGLGPIYIGGTGLWVAETDKVAIEIGTIQGPEAYGLLVWVKNRSSDLITFDPSDFQAFDLVAQKKLTYLPPEKLARMIERPSVWVNLARGFARGAALASQESQQQATNQSSGTFSGSTSSGASFSGTFNADTATSATACDAACAAAKAKLQEQFAREDAARARRGSIIEQIAAPKQTLVESGTVWGVFISPKQR